MSQLLSNVLRFVRATNVGVPLMHMRRSYAVAGMCLLLVLGIAIYASRSTGKTMEVEDLGSSANRSHALRSLRGPRSAPPVPTDATPAATDPAVKKSMKATTVADLVDGDTSAAERLAIKFHNYPDLSGEYRIRADGSISVPVLGRVPVAGLGDAEIETVLAKRLTATTGRETYVTVEVAEYRSVFVSGYVSRPGAYPWRPGMNVLQAVALAGGSFRTTRENSIGGEEEGALLRLQKAINDQKRNLATMARLKAEQSNAAKIFLPDKLVGLVGREEAERVVALETTSFTSRRAALEAKRVALSKAINMAGKELSGLGEQAARLKVILEQRRNYKNSIDKLQSKGIVRAERSIEESARVSDLEDRETAINVSSARVHVLLAQLERDLVNIEHERKAEIDSEIIKVERNIGQLDIEIESARQTYIQSTGHEPPVALILSGPAKKLTLKYEIVRAGEGPQQASADQLQKIRPGDTLVVSAE